MPRKGPAPKRPVVIDPVYGSPLVSQLINKVLLDGKKTVAERTVYEALEAISQKTANDPVITLKKAVENVNRLIWENDFVTANRWMFPVICLPFSLFVGLLVKYRHAPTTLDESLLDEFQRDELLPVQGVR